MKLSLILQQARSGELSSLSAKDKTDEKIVTYINLALIALYGRFQLSSEEAIITLRPDITKVIYTLDSSDHDVKVGTRYMTDEEFMSIVAAFDESGNQLVVNDNKDVTSILTVGYNQVQIPLLDYSGYVSIIYRKNPDLVVYVDNSGSATEADVNLPLQLLEALLHYVGYRAHGAVDGNINTENNTHYMRFEKACQRAEELGVMTADDTMSLSVQAKGYV